MLDNVLSIYSNYVLFREPLNYIILDTSGAIYSGVTIPIFSLSFRVNDDL